MKRRKVRPGFAEDAFFCGAGPVCGMQALVPGFFFSRPDSGPDKIGIFDRGVFVLGACLGRPGLLLPRTGVDSLFDFKPF